MNKAVLLVPLLSAVWCSAQAPAPPAGPTPAPQPPPAAPAPSEKAPPSPEPNDKKAATKELDEKTALRQAEKLSTALKLAREWAGYVKQGKIHDGLNLWGYSAFDGVSREALTESLDTQASLLGPLTYSEILVDRSLVTLDGTAPGSAGAGKGVYVTLNCLNEYKEGLRRETIILHEPADGAGMKITGARLEDLPSGKQAAAELATDLGQLSLLKLRGAPPDRWAPWQREAEALADRLKIKLPSIPDSATGQDKEAGEKLATLVLKEAPPLFDQLGEKGGMHEAKAILNAFALLLLYEPGDETCTRLAVLSGAEAEKAKLPSDLWKPMIRDVSAKEQAGTVHETVQRMAAGIAAHLAEQEIAAQVSSAPRLVLDHALASMEVVPTYKAYGVFTATDGRKCIMDAALGPGAIYLHLEGFDGKKETRLATQQGIHVSHDGEKTWKEDTDLEGIMGLCRTLQLPLDRTKKYPEKNTYTMLGVEKLDGEQLFHFSTDSEEAPDYWVLMSKNGPVIRRAAMTMKFGEVKAKAALIYTKLGKEVDIPEIVEKSKAEAGKDKAP